MMFSRETMNLQVGVKAVLIDKEGKILLLRRSEEKYGKTDGCWDIPGGRIDPGESLFLNLKREVREETNLSIPEDIKLISAQDILLPEKHVVRLTYLINKPVEGQIKLDKAENTEFQWVSVDDARGLADLDRYLRESLRNL